MKKYLILLILFFAYNTILACDAPLIITTSTTSATATILWDTVPGALKYKIKYRVLGATSWVYTAKFVAHTRTITALLANTTYQYAVATSCASGLSLYSIVSTFTTHFALPVPDHVVVCILENHDYSQIFGNTSAPYINGLGADTLSAVFSQAFGLTHPSQPNYIMLYSGTNQGITDNNVPPAYFVTPNLGRQLINSGRSFVTYAEDLPSVGFNGASSGAYVRKHNPVTNWMGTGLNHVPNGTNKPFTSFPLDYNLLPTVSFVVPNLNNDMHDGSVSTGDSWVMNNMNNYVQWAKMHNSLFILMFDENDGSANNHVLTIFCGQMVQSGTYTEHIDHYNLLRTIEDFYGLSHIGGAASVSTIYCWIPPVVRMEETIVNTELIIYPNPADNIIRINNEEITDLLVFDMTGRIICHKEIQPEESLDISSLSSGIYIIRTGKLIGKLIKY